MLSGGFRPRFFLLALLAPALAATAAAQQANSAFVERIQPDDFFAVEAAFPAPIPKNADVAIIATEEGRPVLAVTLAPGAEGDYEVTLIYPSADAKAPGASAAARLVAPLDADTAARIRRALAYRIARNVFVSDVARKAKSYDRAWWILQRSGGGQPAAALITGDAADGSPDARAFMDAFVHGLQNYAIAEPDTRGTVLLAIDRYAIKTLLEEQDKR